MFKITPQKTKEPVFSFRVRIEWADIRDLVGTSNPTWFPYGQMLSRGPIMAPTQVVVG